MLTLNVTMVIVMVTTMVMHVTIGTPDAAYGLGHPQRPDKFTSEEQLRQYLRELKQYYEDNVRRGRFGKRNFEHVHESPPGTGIKLEAEAGFEDIQSQSGATKPIRAMFFNPNSKSDAKPKQSDESDWTNEYDYYAQAQFNNYI